MYTYANGKNNVYEVLPYSLPVLHMGKTCYVDFFCLDPIVGKMLAISGSSGVVGQETGKVR